MSIENKTLYNYVWDNLTKLEDIFSSEIYLILKKYKEKKEIERFDNTLNIILDEELIKKIKSSHKDIKTMSMEEVSDIIGIILYNDFTQKEKYIDRAEYWVENYTKEDEKYAKLLNKLAGLYFSQKEYTKTELLAKKALDIRQRILGDEHPITIGTTKNIDSLMQDLNKLFFLNSNNSNQKFKIANINIKNFKSYKDFSMDFSNQINIIIGQNAIGKTTLLQAITLGLLKDNFLDARELDYNRYITKNENEAEITIGHNSSKKVVKIKKDERVIENNYFIPFVLAYGSNFFTKYNLSADKIVKDILYETIHQGTTDSIFKDFVDEFWNPLTILNELDRSEHQKAEEKREIFFETINSFLEGYKLLEENKRYFFRKENDSRELYLEDLSEGYRGNILLITNMLVKILGVGWTPQTIEGVVLIDEFDKHLHPRWQSRLVNQLKTTFPNIQFIMTTHNPMSILDRDGDEITILKEIDGEVRAIKKYGTKDIDISIVLLEYFNVESTVGDEMRGKINTFNRLKLKKELTQKEAEELEKLEISLGNTIASNLIYDRKYLKFLEFIRDNKEIDEDKMSEFLKDFGDFFDD